MNTSLQAPLVVPSGEGPYVGLGDHWAWVKVPSEQTGGSFLFTEIGVECNGGVPPHIHYREDETFYMLSGQYVFEVGGRTIEVGPGDTVFGPRGVAHTWRCTSPEGGRLLILFTPGANFQMFAQAMGEMQASPQADMVNADRIAGFVALAAKHGIEMLPPGK